jgi:hypothetical protein
LVLDAADFRAATGCADFRFTLLRRAADFEEGDFREGFILLQYAVARKGSPPSLEGRPALMSRTARIRADGATR